MTRVFVVLAIILCAGCAGNKQTVRVEASTPPARPGQTTLHVYYQVEAK